MAPRTPSLIDGVVLADKPAGASSRETGMRVARELGELTAGHAGTLDPFATGLLIVLLGRARRVQRFFTALPKEYLAVACFGATSSTGDPEGEITRTGTAAPATLELPVGRIRQRPPAHSAVRVGGVRAYKLARRGEAVELPEREVTVYAFEELWREQDRVGLRIVCSAGTYVRSLVADLGDAYTCELRRTAIGALRVEDADEQRPLELGRAIGFFRSLQVEGEDARRARHGVAIEPQAPLERPGADWLLPEPPAEILLRDADGPIALAVEQEGGMLKPVVGFRA